MIRSDAGIDFRRHTVDEVVGWVRSGERSAAEVVEGALERIESLQPALNAFTQVDRERALAQAAVIEERIARGEDVGPLAGVPIGVKDLEDAEGFTTSHGSLLYKDGPRATRDSIQVERLRAAGAVVVGKTNTPEDGNKAVTDGPAFGPARNPWDPDRATGGSSGGSAAALASGMVPLATGSDGGGSIRIPSACCGLSGLKPTQGRVPNGGAEPPGAGLLSTRGPMALRARDIALALDVVIGSHPTDVMSAPRPHTPHRVGLENPALPERVIWARALYPAEIDREIAAVCEQAVKQIGAAGVEVVERDGVLDEDPAVPWFAMWASSIARTWGHLRGTPDWDRLDPELRAQAEYGLDRVTGVDFQRGLDAVHTVHFQLLAALDEAPLIVTPTVAGQTGRAGQQGSVNDEVTHLWVRFTYPLNLSRNPAGTVRAGLTSDGMPVGLQVIGRRLDDGRVLEAMAAFEEVLDAGWPVP